MASIVSGASGDPPSGLPGGGGPPTGPPSRIVLVLPGPPFCVCGRPMTEANQDRFNNGAWKARCKYCRDHGHPDSEAPTANTGSKRAAAPDLELPGSRRPSPAMMNTGRRLQDPEVQEEYEADGVEEEVDEDGVDRFEGVDDFGDVEEGDVFGGNEVVDETDDFGGEEDDFAEEDDFGGDEDEFGDEDVVDTQALE